MVDEIVNPMKEASRAALGQFSQLVGVNTIPRETIRKAIRNMTPDDLDILANEYGVDQVIHLIGSSYGGQHAR